MLSSIGVSTVIRRKAAQACTVPSIPHKQKNWHGTIPRHETVHVPGLCHKSDVLSAAKSKAMKVEKYNSLTGGGRPPWPATSVLRDVELPFADATKIFMQSQVSDGVFGWFSLCGQDRLALEFQMRKELFAIFDLAQGAAVGCTRRKFSADWREELEGTELGFLEMLTTRRANVKTAWQRGPRYPGKTLSLKKKAQRVRPTCLLHRHTVLSKDCLRDTCMPSKSTPSTSAGNSPRSPSTPDSLEDGSAPPTLQSRGWGSNLSYYRNVWGLLLLGGPANPALGSGSLWAVLTGNQRHGVDLMSDKNCPTSFVMMT